VWAQQGDIKATDSMTSMPQGPQGLRGGKLSSSPEEPGFAGKVRIQPGDDAAFRSGRIARADDDDDQAYPARRGSRAGMWIALLSLLVIGAAAGVVYMFVFKQKDRVAQPAATGDAAVGGDAASTVVVTPIDAGVETPADALGTARAELLAGVTARMKASLEGLTGKDDPASLAMRARLSTAIAQAMTDRAAFVDKAEGDKLRKGAKQMVLDTMPLAQRAFNGQQDSASANLAMAEVMRMQAKPAPAVKRYIDGARSRAAGNAELLASVALADALLAMRDGNLPVADKALAAVDAPDDMRVKTARAQIAYAQNKAADAKALVDQVLATQPDNDVALALYKKLETVVAKDDPLPPEDGSAAPPKNPTNPTNPTNTGGGGGGGGDYDSVLAKANKLAETSCAKAMELYAKALELKPNGVEALTGMGYCHLDAKQFSSAFSKFRAALFVSSRYEPALGGVAETYQRQGNKDAAIEAWQKYLEMYPTSAKAKKQLEILGASGGGGTPPEKKPEGGGDGSASPPPPAPTPTPPAPDGSASQ
jgi:tetratricopeptide (TPR) repeat protein